LLACLLVAGAIAKPKQKPIKRRVADLEAAVAALQAQGATAGQQGPQGPPGPAGVALFATVNADGSLKSGTPGVTSRVHSAQLPSNYIVTFPQSVTGCAAVATPESGTANTLVAFSGFQNVDVVVRDGGLAPRAFSLAVACP